MAIYEYDCEQCGTFEVLQKMTDAPLETHERCGKPVTRRVSRSSFALKGAGWYSDGYSSASANPSGACSTGTCGTGSCGS